MSRKVRTVRVRPTSIRPAQSDFDPRTHGLREDSLAAPGVLPARMPHMDVQKARIAQGYGWHSSHESSHGSQAEPGEDPSQ